MPPYQASRHLAYESASHLSIGGKNGLACRPVGWPAINACSSLVERIQEAIRAARGSTLPEQMSKMLETRPVLLFRDGRTMLASYAKTLHAGMLLRQILTHLCQHANSHAHSHCLLCNFINNILQASRCIRPTLTGHCSSPIPPAGDVRAGPGTSQRKPP